MHALLMSLLMTPLVVGCMEFKEKPASDADADADADTDADADADADTDADADADTDADADADMDADADTGEDSASPPPPPTVQVYLLAGQSNMDGAGEVISLPADLRVAQEDVWIYWSGIPTWRGLVPSSNWTTGWGTYFGPEVTFGRTLADASDGTQIALIKHAVGGTALSDFWYPGESAEDPSRGAGYTQFTDTVTAALSDLEALELTPEIAGMIWMQGESDAFDVASAEAYQSRMTAFIRRVREDVATPSLPFSMGLIDCESMCPYRDTIRAAQTAVASADLWVSTIETDDVGSYVHDPIHYHGIGQRVMGQRFAQALLGTERSAVPQPAFTLTGRYEYGYYGYFTLGYTFTVDRPVWITDLGMFDLDADGLNHASDIGIWGAADEALITTETLPATESDASPLIGNFRYVAVAPVYLEPGEYVIGNETFGLYPDLYVYNAAHTPAAGMTWIEGRHIEGSSLAFPTTVVAGTADASAWFGPNFLVLEAAE
jgi:hypothetical protein